MLKPVRALAPVFVLLSAAAFLLPSRVGAQVSLTTLGTAYTQSFDALPPSGSATWTNNSTIPGWFHARTGTGTTIVANNGSSNAGNLYSYGTGTATDRALGSLGSGNAAIGNLFWGVRLQNNTGATITALDVSYTGEQWRNSAAAAQTIAFSYLVGSPTVTGSLAEFQSPGTALTSLDFTSPVTGAGTPALDGNLAANRTTIAFTISGLSIPNGTEVMLRWSDPDHTGADHGLSIDDFSVTPQAGLPVASLNISDVTMVEGDPAGTTTFTFAVTLTAPTTAVTFDIATADGTAQDGNPLGEDNDYVAQSLTGQSIPLGSTGPYNFSVTVNRDVTVEPNETFFVNVTNVVGANAGDVQGLGTINNDDVALTPIHDIQGPGASSPLFGTVTTRGIVTGVKNNGFFIQEPDASVDADPATSEGILIFTSSAPPGAAAVGNLVQVTGTISEFVPSQDPLQPPLTELTSPSVLLISSGNPLPAPVPLTATFPDPAGPFDQLERLEGMRVGVASLTVVGPTLGNVDEVNATATSTGVFFGVVTGVARPFREPGIQAPDPAPSGSIPPIPRFDTNPERIRVDSDGQTGGAIVDVGTGAVVTGLVGPLDYSFRTYTIQPDPASPLVVVGGPTATPVTPPTTQELTIAAYNLERFFDTVNDPAKSDSILTAAAFNKRLDKASLSIRGFLRAPDILGVVEVENLTTLQALASRISADAIAASEPDPMYVAYLSEGNDVGGIDVGFLVKTSVVFGSTPRVAVVAVTQEGLTTTWTDPSDNSTQLLNDRPSLVLEAEVNHPNGASFPVTVIVNHLRSLIGVNDESTAGLTTTGNRVRQKRLRQAEFLANLVQARQTADPNENIILVGDFNAFEFNDGFVDSMGIIQGDPPPAAESVLSSTDLVNPDLVNLSTAAPAAERYSFVFDGNAQSLDHAVINAALISSTLSHREEHPRVNSDFPETDRNSATSAVRLADHDPIVAYFQVADFATAGLSVDKVDGPDPVRAGAPLTYTITVTNGGPDAAVNPAMSDTLPAGTTFQSLSSPAGWSCTTPAVGAGGTVSCSAAALAASDSAVFTLGVQVDPAVAAGTVISNTASVSSGTIDPTPGDDSSMATTTVAAAADYNLTLSDTPDPVLTGQDITYTITVSNEGPSQAETVVVTDTLPAGTTFRSLSAPGGWSCITPAVGSGGSISCSIAAFAPGSAVFTLVVRVDASVTGGTTISNTAIVTSTTADSNPGDTSETVSTTVLSPALLSATKAVAGDFVPGGAITYTIVLTNTGAHGQVDAAGDELSDPLPTGLLLTGASATSGTAVANIPTNTVTWNGPLAAGASVTITIQATIDPAIPVGQTIANQAMLSFDADGDGTNEASGVSDDPEAGGGNNPTSFVVVAEVDVIEVPTLDSIGLALLIALLALGGAKVLRRRTEA